MMKSDNTLNYPAKRKGGYLNQFRVSYSKKKKVNVGKWSVSIQKIIKIKHDEADEHDVFQIKTIFV
jgi:hypothetical protein